MSRSKIKNSGLKSQRGATMVEAGLLIALVCVICVVAAKGVGYAIRETTCKGYLANAGTSFSDEAAWAGRKADGLRECKKTTVRGPTSHWYW